MIPYLEPSREAVEHSLVAGDPHAYFNNDTRGDAAPNAKFLAGLIV
jgi:hypothetical protein